LSSFFRFFLLSIIFSPLLLNLYDLSIATIGDIDSLDYFFKESTLNLVRNSIYLSATVATIATLGGGILALLFFGLSQKLKQLYILLLFLFFAIEPIIYLGAFQQTALFAILSPFWQSVSTLGLSMVGLCGLIFIFALSFINQESLRVASMVASNRDILRFIIKPQLLFTLFLAFFMVFVLVFSHQEVSSILGYRTYAEDFLAQISLMEDISQTALASVPFYLLAMVILGFLLFFVKFYHLKFELKERLDTLIFTSISPKVINSIFSFLLFLFLMLLFCLIMQIDFREFDRLIEENYQIVIDSLVVASIVSVVAMVLSLFLYRVIERFGSFITIALVLLMLLTPSALIGLEVIKIAQYLNTDSIFMDYLFFILSSSIKLMPIGVGVISVLYYRDIEDESLRFFAISKIDIFLKITLPTYGKRWIFVILILMIFALNELSISILLIPIGFEVLIIKIYNLLHYGDYSAVTFLSLVQIAIILIVLMVIRRLNDRVT
jgi:ABC-type Fe3+ transport system permease subunit